ncbi:MAG: response regulator [Bacteroidia bacterium]
MGTGTEYIYMLEEDPDDRIITSETLNELGIGIPFFYFSDPDELISSLHSGKRPSLILLDYQSATSPGLELLKTLKSSGSFNDIPVVVLGELSLRPMIRECYSLGANSYITKPSDIQQIQLKIKTFIEYWFTVAEI